MLSRLAQYDSYERHIAAKLLLEPVHPQSILDVGGIGWLRSFLPGARVLTLNIDRSGDVRYGGGTFPLAAQAFDAVVSLDTLEHLPQDYRQGFLAECVRVARHAVLIAAPLGTPGHAAYEARLNALHRLTHGASDRWLHEHVTYGLPTEADLVEWTRWMRECGFAAQVRYAGDYSWQCRNMERSLWLVRRLGLAGRLIGLMNLVPSMAIWHPVVLSARAHERTNRFYLLCERRRGDIKAVLQGAASVGRGEPLG